MPQESVMAPFPYPRVPNLRLGIWRRGLSLGQLVEVWAPCVGATDGRIGRPGGWTWFFGGWI